MPSLWVGKVQEIFKISLIIFTFIYIIILFAYTYTSTTTQIKDIGCFFSLNENFLGIIYVNRSVINSGKKYELSDIPVYDKFIAANYKYCGGFGSQLYHFSTYYGIGRALNRTPFFYSTKPCEIEFLTEIKTIFPNLFHFMPLLNPSEDDTINVPNLKDFCNVDNLKENNETYLIFEDYVPHFYQYFLKYNADIRYFMDLDVDFKENVKFLSKQLFRGDTNHKFCIHIRRSEFTIEAYRFQESKPEFIIPASTYIYNFLNKTGHSNVSLILMGEDNEEGFKDSLQINVNLFEHIYFQQTNKRAQDLAFGVLNCDTFLISASGSAFAWWIGYLLPEGKNIFYNGQIYKDENSSKFPFAKVFPPHWNKINIV